MNIKFVCLLPSPADHSALHAIVACCLSATLVTLALVAGFLLFKVELALAHRKLLRQFAKPQGKDLNFRRRTFLRNAFFVSARN